MRKIILIVATAFAAVTAFAQPKFAHVNSTELVQLCPEMDKVRETLNELSKDAQETFNDMQADFNNKLAEYQSKGSTWSQAIRESKEKELTQMQQRIQEFSQSAPQELQQKQEELVAPIYQKVNETIQDLAKKGGFVYVFDVQSVLYVDAAQSTDLTAEARKILGVPEDRTLESLAAELQAQQAAAQQ